MVVLLKRTCHSCPTTMMLYAYPSSICPHCQGQGIDIEMTTDEMIKENVKRQFEKKLKGGL